MRTAISRSAWLAVLLGNAAGACTVPVFRYALDNWTADAYRLEAPEGWSESAAGRKLLDALRESRTEIEVVPGEGGAAEGRLVMPGPASHPVWSGDLDESAAQLFTSPAREELARRILAGESMVWVMVTSGEAGKDEGFESRLRARLAYLGEVAAIPEQDPHDPASRLGPGPKLRAGFSLLKVARDDPSEQVFLLMLAGPDGAGLLETPEPFAGVVFGRGRVLGAWPATALDDEGIDEVSLFLLGACSCRVKYQNPGWDLALAVDWDTRLMAAQFEAERVEVEGEAGTEPAETGAEPAIEPEVVSFDGAANEAEPADAEPAGMSTFLLVAIVAGALALLAGVTIFLRRSH